MLIARNFVAQSAALLFLFSCVGEQDFGPLPDEGKSDLSDGILRKGLLDFGQANSGNATLGDFFPFHYWTLPDLDAGAVISIRTTKISDDGESADTTLTLARRSDDDQLVEVAFADDGGIEEYAILNEISIDEPGEYLVIVSTPDGVGHGDYQIALDCDSDACLGKAAYTELEEADLALSADFQLTLEQANTAPNNWFNVNSYRPASTGAEITIESAVGGLRDFFAGDEVEWLAVPADDFSRGTASFLLSFYGLSLPLVEEEFGLEDYELAAVERFWDCNETSFCEGFLIAFLPAESDELVVFDFGSMTE